MFQSRSSPRGDQYCQGPAIDNLIRCILLRLLTHQMPNINNSQENKIILKLLKYWDSNAVTNSEDPDQSAPEE